MAKASLVGVILVSLFLLFTYNQSEYSGSVRAAIEDIGKELLGDGPMPDVEAEQPAGDTRLDKSVTVTLPDGKDVSVTPGGDETLATGLDSEGDLAPVAVPAPQKWIESGTGKVDTKKLAQLNVETNPRSPYAYNREEQFTSGPTWADPDKNGCDARNDTIARDLVEVTRDGDCKVTGGFLGDPYSGNTYRFNYGTSSRLLDIEHIVALEQAWNGGAWEWSQAKRVAYANDPEVLILVDGPLNRQKGASTISEWMPPNKDAQCRYAEATVDIEAKYDLTISRDDYQVLAQMAKRCNG